MAARLSWAFFASLGLQTLLYAPCRVMRIECLQLQTGYMPVACIVADSLSLPSDDSTTIEAI